MSDTTSSAEDTALPAEDSQRPCRCGRLRVGLEVTEHRNWNPECPEHGIGTDWWHSDDQQAKRHEAKDRLTDLQAKAREARRGTQ